MLFETNWERFNSMISEHPNQTYYSSKPYLDCNLFHYILLRTNTHMDAEDRKVYYYIQTSLNTIGYFQALTNMQMKHMLVKKNKNRLYLLLYLACLAFNALGEWDDRSKMAHILQKKL